MVNVTAVSNTKINVASIPAAAAIGQSLYQAPYLSLITDIDSVNNFITVEDDLTWNVSSNSTYVVVPIPVSIVTTPIYANDPTMMKQFSEYSIIVDGTSQAEFDITFLTDANKIAGSIIETVPASSSSAYGVGPYGVGPYGGGSVTNTGSRLRNYLPASVQKCNWLIGTFQVSEAFSKVAFSGLQFVYRPLTVY